MNDTQRIVKCGSLALHSPGGLFKKKWQSKYLVLYDGSRSGIKRLELFDSEIKFKKQNPAKIIPLVDCVRVVTCQRQKSTYTFEVRTSDQFYLLAAQSFQDMNDWVNCLRLVAFGQQAHSEPTATATTDGGAGGASQMQKQQQQRQQAAVLAAASAAISKRLSSGGQVSTSAAGSGLNGAQTAVDMLLERRAQPPTQQVAASAMSRGGAGQHNLNKQLPDSDGTSLASSSTASPGASKQQNHASHVVAALQRTPLVPAQQITTASQAAAAAAKARQRQPSLLGSCKPQPPTDSPFVKPAQETVCSPAALVAAAAAVPSQGAILLNSIGRIDTLTPTVRGQLIEAASSASSGQQRTPAQVSIVSAPATHKTPPKLQIQATLDEEEENMLYCSIEDNPSEHNYRVKVIETELALRCQLKCYQLTAPTTISQQYEELSQFRLQSGNRFATNQQVASDKQQQQREAAASLAPPVVTFYQLIIGPQELTLLNDYATFTANKQQQQGLWSWPYQCIRRYGFDKDNCFMFEAGRKCSSGPGQFVVQTPKAYNIYQDIVKFVNELRAISSTSMTCVAEPNIEQPLAAARPPQADQPQVAAPARQTVVTQIPVIWTPDEQKNSPVALSRQQTVAAPPTASPQAPPLPPKLDEKASGGGGSSTIESRKHFFDTLLHSRPLSTAGHDGQPPTRADAELSPLKTAASIDAGKTTTTSLTGHLHESTLRGVAGQQQRPVGQAALSQQRASPTSSSAASPSSHDGGQSAISSPALSDGGDESGNCPPTSGGDPIKKTIGGTNQLNKSVSVQQQSENNLLRHKAKRLVAAAAAAASTAGQPIENGDSRGERPSSQAATSGSTSDETDESGYDQGDESVDSGSAVASSRFKGAPLGACRKRTSTTTSAANGEPLSWSNSSASSSLNSPGQSVSKSTSSSISAAASRCNGSQDQPTNKTLAKRSLLTSSRHVKEQNAARMLTGGDKMSIDLHNLIAGGVLGDQPDDFETNLIRDVYGEITKLHAKFAVTTSGSAEDSMSSNSSRESCVSDQSGANELELDYQHNVEGEPMYSNVAADRANMSRPTRQRDNLDEIYCETQHNQHHAHYLRAPPRPSNQAAPMQQHIFGEPHYHQASSYATNSGAGAGQPIIYPTPLKPIPECGEAPPPVAPKPQRLGNLAQPIARNDKSEKVARTTTTIADNGLPRARLAFNRNELKKHSLSQKQQTSCAPSKKRLDNVSKKPTNHYVINDVQYAKISRRNLAANLEACL